MAFCSSQEGEHKKQNPQQFQIYPSKDRVLKGILKTFENGEGRLKEPGSLDFKNECRILNLSRQTVGPCETISSRRMDRTGISDFHQAEQRLTSHQTEEDDESYFIAAFSSDTPSKMSKWIRTRERESSPSSISVAGMRGNYSQDPAIQLSRFYNAGKCQNNCSGRPESSLTRRLIFRLFQVTSFLLIIMGIIALVTPPFMTPELEEILNTTSANKSTESTTLLQPSDLRHSLVNWAIPGENNSSESKYSKDFINSTELHLLNIPNLHFSLNNFQLCTPTSTSNSSGIYFLILVHSAPSHFVERQAIRTSWGSVKSFRNWSVRIVFLLGQISNHRNNSSIQEGILGESDLYGDIISGNFDDTYRNLTYKHLMGYKWVLNHCPLAKFVIKTDDDAFIDIFQVFDFAQRNYGLNPNNILLCNIYPEGTQPVRNSTAQNPDGFKWIVTKDEYPFGLYPKYCGGLGYLATVDVIQQLSGISDRVTRFLWIDDVFVTGVLRELAGVEPFYLNLRYSYDEAEYRDWLNDRSSRHRLRKIPYMFVHVPRGDRFDEDMSRLWRKTVRAWS